MEAHFKLIIILVMFSFTHLINLLRLEDEENADFSCAALMRFNLIVFK